MAIMSARTTSMERPRSCAAYFCSSGGYLLHIGGDQMVGNDVFQEIEPEQRELGQHPALLRDAGGQHVVERRDAIGGHEQQVIVVDLVKVANLAAGVQLEVGKVGLQKNVGSCG